MQMGIENWTGVKWGTAEADRVPCPRSGGMSPANWWRRRNRLQRGGWVLCVHCVHCAAVVSHQLLFCDLCHWASTVPPSMTFDPDAEWCAVLHFLCAAQLASSFFFLKWISNMQIFHLRWTLSSFLINY